MGFKEENYTPKGLCLGMALWMMIICNHALAQSAPHCPVKVDFEPRTTSVSNAPSIADQNLFPFFNSWQDLNNIRLSDDVYTTVTLDAYKRSTMLVGDQMSFNIPAGAQVTGIEILVEGHTRGEGFVEGQTIQLLNYQGVRAGNNYAHDELPIDRDWPATADSTDFTWRYGGDKDDWGLDLDQFLINNSNFGFAFQVRNKLATNVEVLIDNIQIVVHYIPLYTVCSDHACVPFYINESDDPQFTYEWYLPQGWELISDSENDAAINIGPSYATFGIYEICVESFFAGDSQGLCCRSFSYEDCNPGMISGLAFLDQNGNFSNDANDLVQTNILVNLYQSDGTFVTSTLSDGDGRYTFESVFEGDYYILVSPDDGFTFVIPNIGSEIDDSDIDNTFGEGTTGLISVQPNDIIDNIGIGLSRSLSIGDFVWEDLNGDGIQQEGEPGIPGVEVLITNNLILQITTTTDQDGFYQLSDLPSSDYNLNFTASDLFIPTISNATSPESDSDFDGGLLTISYYNGGEIDSIDAGFFRLGSIGDFVWEDLNMNGIQDTDEPGIERVQLYLTDESGTRIDSIKTGEDGDYTFANLAPGTYTIEVEEEDYFTLTESDMGDDDTTDSDGIIIDGLTQSPQITLTSNQEIKDIDFGFFIQPVDIVGFTWIDANNDGQYQPDEAFLGEVSVSLYDMDDNLINQTTSDIGGYFEFIGENPGTYYLQYEMPEGYIFTISNTGDDLTDSDVDGSNGDGSTMLFTLLPGDVSLDNAAGYQLLPSVSGLVWEDIDGDGIRQTEEPLRAGIEVMLFNISGIPEQTTITSTQGAYEFENIPVSDYYIEFKIEDGDQFTKSLPATPMNSDVTEENDIGTTGTFSLVGNQMLTDIDAGYYTPGSIGDFVWEDINMNGIQDEGEPGLAGVMIALTDANGMTLATRSTNESGFYIFTGLAPASYNVVFIPQDSYSTTLVQEGDNPELDSDAELNDGEIVISPIQITSGVSLLDQDAGFFLDPASIGGITWIDQNNDGQYQNEELYIANIKVTLFSADDMIINETVSNAAGFYNFTNVIPGDYYVQFSLPDGHIYTIANEGNDSSDSDVNESNGSGTTDIFSVAPGEISMMTDVGYQVLPKVGDYAWLDENKNGIQDDDEIGLNGISVTLYDNENNIVETTITDNNPASDKNGYYLFNMLPVGEYYIQFQSIDTLAFSSSDESEPSLNSDVTGENGIGTTATFSLVGNQCNLDIDAGYSFLQNTISGEVWVDSDGDGIQIGTDSLLSGITVEIFGQGDISAGTTTTDAAGKYSFTDLDDGSYYIVFSLGDRYLPSLPSQGNDDATNNDVDESQAINSTNIIELSNGADLTDIDAGVIDGAVTIGGFAWEDTNNNGILDSGEPALDSINVKLYTLDGLLLDSVDIDEMGNYEFTYQVAGQYYLVFENQDSSYYNVLANQGMDDNLDDDITDDIQPNSTDTIIAQFFTPLPAYSAGYYQYASIGDMVFIDSNDDDINNDEPGIDGVTVILLDMGGDTIKTTITAQGGGLDSGYYLIDSIIPGDYQLLFERPLFYQFVNGNVGTNDTIDSDVTTVVDRAGTTDVLSLTSGSSNTNIDAGLEFSIPSESSITGLVWDDVNMNGTREPEEPKISGLSISLLNGNGVEVENTLTDGDGGYAFSMLLEGFYTVIIAAPNNKTTTIANVGMDDTIDSDFNITMDGISSSQFFLANFEEKSSLDLGLVNTVTIGDFVWEDQNNNGTQEGGEPGIEGIDVSLLNINDEEIGNTTTDNEGKYQFVDYPAGMYRVCIELPDSFLVAKKFQGIEQLDSDANEDGCTDLNNITVSTNNIDIGLIKQATVNGVVFTDLKGNGTNNPGDPGIDDVKVVLITAGGLRLDSTFTLTTEEVKGGYSFSGVAPGDYYIAFDIPTEFLLSDGNSAPDDVDSDITNAFGFGTTDLFTVSSGENKMNVDGGAYLPASIGGSVWNDDNKDGLRDPGEVGVVGIEVGIFSSIGLPIDTVITNANGDYVFEELKQGLYFIQFLVPQQLTITLENVDINDDVDSDADETGKTALISLAHGADLDNVDCGVFESMASLRSVVWEDLNGDGLRQDVEARIPDIRITLFTEDDQAIASTVTNTLGLYAFQEIPPGDYKVFVDLTDTEYAFTTANMSTNDFIDSDINDNGESDVFQSAAVLSVPNVDVGLFEMGTINSTVWNDENQNGIFDLEESTLSGVRVKLYNDSNIMVNELVSNNDLDENVIFSNLRPGTYHIEYAIDKSMNKTIQYGGIHMDNNSDVIQKLGKYMSPDFTVSSAQATQSIDAGFYKMDGSIQSGSEIFVTEANSDKDLEKPIASIITKEKLDVSIHPNPATNYLKVMISDTNNAMVKVMSAENKILVSTSGSEMERLDISDLHPGIYFIMVTNGEQSITKKFIKVH